MKSVTLPLLLLVFATPISGFDVDFMVRSNVPEDWRDGGSEHDPVLISAWQLSGRLCKQYPSIPGFCEALVQAVTEANDDAVLMAIPAKLPPFDQPTDNFSSSFTDLIEQQVISPLPQNLDIQPASAWSVNKYTTYQEKMNETLVMDAILRLGYTGPSTNDLGAIQRTYFPEGDEFLLIQLKAYLQNWVQDEVDASAWTSIENLLNEFQTKFADFKTKVDAKDSASSDAIRSLVSFAAGKEAYFKPYGSGATFFPLYVAWSSMAIITYRATLCGDSNAKLIGEEDLKLVRDAYHRLVNDVVTHGASVELTYNLWFLMNSKYLSAGEIINHFQLRYAFDYALWAGKSRDACTYWVSESKAPAAYSAIPLFNGSIVDNVGEARERLMYDFFVSVMTYTLPKRRLVYITAQPGVEDEGSDLFTAFEMKYQDGTSEKYGTIDSSKPVTWDLVSGKKIYKLRGLRYEFGGQEEDLAYKCSTGAPQRYRQKFCWNRFDTSAAINSTKGQWRFGKVTEPEVVIPEAQLRLLNGFVAFPTGSDDAHLEDCSHTPSMLL